MKIHITNRYGNDIDRVAINQKRIALAGRTLGFCEMGIFVYPTETDTVSELSKRQDGIIAAVEYGDFAIIQLPTGNGIDYECLLIDKIVAYSSRRVLLLWHDEEYRDQNQERLAGYACLEKNAVYTENCELAELELFLVDMIAEADASALPNYQIQKSILQMLINGEENVAYDEAIVDKRDFYIRKMLFDVYTYENEKKLRIHVKTINETLDYVLEHHSSVARFGDGEMDIIAGNSIPYQDYRESLAKQLKEIMTMQSDENIVVCLSDVFERRERYNDYAANFWKQHLEQYQDYYINLCTAEWYGSTFISRPYMDLVDKSPCAGYFAKIRKIWDQRDVLIVEGINSRSGVGNDLFDNAASVQRIICPSKNAYDLIDSIQNEVEKYADGKLILLMLGPTAKVLVKRLSDRDYQAIDLGHIDSEYEWFKMGATSKVKLEHKHTAEHNFDENIKYVSDTKYEQQILIKLL